MTLAAIDRPIRLARLTTRAWLGLLAFDAARLAGFANLYAWLAAARFNGSVPGRRWTK